MSSPKTPVAAVSLRRGGDACQLPTLLLVFEFALDGCLVHINYHPRFFCENVNGQYAHIVALKKNFIAEYVGKLCFMCKNVVCFFCADEEPQTDPFFAVLNVYF